MVFNVSAINHLVRDAVQQQLDAQKNLSLNNPEFFPTVPTVTSLRDFTSPTSTAPGSTADAPSGAAGSVGEEVGQIEAGLTERLGEGPEVEFDPNDPSRTFASIIQREEFRRQNLFNPLLDDTTARLREGLGPTAGEARDRVAQQQQRGLERQRRERRRFGGADRLTGVEQRENIRAFQRSTRLGQVDASAQARFNRADRTDTLRRELINIGRGVQDESIGAITEASALQTQRETQNRVSEQQDRASRAGAAASAIALLIAI
jgi:hypothetical protein